MLHAHDLATSLCSGNADASICTATTFGVFEQPKNNTAATNAAEGDHEQLIQNVLQPAKNMRAAGYCLYSSATVLVFTLNDGGVYGFTLDPQIQDFVLTHRDLTIPKRGNVYSCNEANSEGWDENWKEYLRNIKLGQGETKKPYALRYVGKKWVGHLTQLYCIQ
jgi:fructose-1,6-bisphosphatase I